MKYFFDSYAILEIIQGNPKYVQLGEASIVTNTLNLAEVFYGLLRTSNEDIANNTINKLSFIFLDITSSVAIEASKFRYKHKKIKLSYADSIGYISAKKNKVLFLTGDQAFAQFENVEFVK
mgnify:CR=1 FL=1